MAANSVSRDHAISDFKDLNISNTPVVFKVEMSAINGSNLLLVTVVTKFDDWRNFDQKVKSSLACI